MTMGATAHLDFIAAAYAAAVIVIGGLVAWVAADFRAQQKHLGELETQGVSRRSAAARADSATGDEKAGEKAKEQA